MLTFCPNETFCLVLALFLCHPDYASASDNQQDPSMPVHSSSPIGRVALRDLTSENLNTQSRNTSSGVPKKSASLRFQYAIKKPFSNVRSRLLLHVSSVNVKKPYLSFAELPVDVQQAIASRLGILDLYRARIACLGLAPDHGKPTSVGMTEASIDPGQDLWQENLVRSIRALQPLWECWVNDSRPNSRRRRLATTPLEFVTKVRRLSLPSATPEILTSVFELTKLLELDLSREGGWRGTRLDNLPNAIASCTRLRVLKLSRCSFKSLPECVLRLRKLRRLDLDSNTELTALPCSIGDRLKQLAIINISGCEKTKELPRSLLKTLENNMKKLHAQLLVNPRIKKDRLPLLLSKDYFEDGYLERVLNPRDFPRLVQAVDRSDNPGTEEAPGI